MRGAWLEQWNMVSAMKRVLNYLKEVERQWQTGQATEHSYRPALAMLLRELLPDVTVINEPAHIECGAPDFLLRTNAATNAPVGYIEAKDVGDADLDGNKANREQFDRYKKSLPNLAFADYLDFHFYEGGEFKEAIRIGEIRGGKIVAAKEDVLLHFIGRVERFGAARPASITSPQLLAKLMAGKARLLSRAIRATIASDAGAKGTVSRQMRTVKRFLIRDLTEDAFADIYAQTITYGLFAARLHDGTPENFSREEAAHLLPKTNPLMRKMFLDIAQELDQSLEWIVEDLVALFASTDVDAIMHAYSNAGGDADPVLHFYENFLTEYDPTVRRQRGVWYTPTPVVRFIVRAVDKILERDFGLTGGLADKSQIVVNVKEGQTVSERKLHRVQILDPATGTGAFLAETIRRVRDKFVAAKQEGLWPSYAAADLLPRLNGFEILMASYAMAHLKLDMLLTETGCSPAAEQRLRVFLTNALENLPIPDTADLLAAALASEADEANAVKRDYPVMVVVGNPPYSGESQNKGSAIMHLMEDYKMEPGGKEKLKERNPKWINDDYVKFLRLAQDYIDRSGEGVIGFINPHGFLDNPTFRGVRWKLLESFDEIYVLNLHGNTKKKETAPDGSKDENVFDIMQGVSINIFVKRKGSPKDASRCSVHYADLWGKREDKYAFLDANGLESVVWQTVTPTTPMFFFVPKDTQGEEVYNSGFSVAELFPVSSSGVVSANDELNFSFSEDEQRIKLEDLLRLPENEWRTKYHRTQDSRDWTYAGAKTDAQNSKGVMCKAAYRLFDARWTCYTGVSRGLYTNPRDKVMRHFVGRNNLGLVTLKGFPRELTPPIFITNTIIEHRYWSCSGMQGTDYVFPLYLFHDGIEEIDKIAPNLNPQITAQIMASVDGDVTPEDIFHYIYAVLHTPEYLRKYSKFLKVDFPRIPYPQSADAFRRFAEIGRSLVEAHLLRSTKTKDMFDPLAAFPVTGDNHMETLRFGDGKVHINATQYFDNVPESAWQFFIGGYQPAQKWLKDRKGRVLSSDDILHYKAIIIALTETERLMAELSSVAAQTGMFGDAC